MFLFFVCNNLHAQNDSVPYSRDFVMKEGIYLTYLDFRSNTPILKNSIKSKQDREQLDFLVKTLEENDTITYLLNGKEQRINTDSLWGFCQNKTIYINYLKKFYRIPVFGNISHFIAAVEITTYPPASYYNNAAYYNAGATAIAMPVKSKEIRQFMLDFYTGRVLDFNAEDFTELISRDKKLSDEFNALKRRKQKKLIGVYLRRYNDAHPVFFPKS